MATIVSMLRGQDILVLVRLLGEEASPTIAQLAADLGIDGASVHRSLGRLREVQLISSERRANVPQADEFLTHGLRYVFPARFAGESRGVPTAWAVESLRDVLAPSGSPPPVWAHPKGTVRGIALEPLHESAADVAFRDPGLAVRFALVDAMRVGDVRVRAIAREQLLAAAGLG